MKYYERVQALRLNSGMSQEELAEKVYVCQRTFSDYESGITRIPIDVVQKLAQIFDVSMDYITCASDVKKPYPQK